MIRPWYRSRLFWLGLPGLVFLLWLSSACPPRLLMMERGDHAYGMAVGVDDGVRLFSLESKDGGFSRSLYFDDPSSLQKVPPGPPIRFTNAGSNKAFGFTRTDGVVAYSLVIPLYLVFWIGPLAGWQRRKARRLRASANPPR